MTLTFIRKCQIKFFVLKFHVKVSRIMPFEQKQNVRAVPQLQLKVT